MSKTLVRRLAIGLGALIILVYSLAPFAWIGIASVTPEV
jgi:hypothetical protein